MATAITRHIGRVLARFLAKPRGNAPIATSPPALLAAALLPGDVLRVEGDTRICRPIGLRPEDRAGVVSYLLSRLGQQYDLKNVFDLARYLIRTPPVPVRWRRRMIALGSGDPTRAICSTLIPQAFQSISYPTLPEISIEKLDDPIASTATGNCCTSATAACSRRGTSTCRRFSPS